MHNRKLLVILFFVAACIYLVAESFNEGDLYIFLCAGGDVGSGTDIFRKEYLTYYHYYYSVLFAFVMKPFYYLPFTLVRFLWITLNFAMATHLFYLLAKSPVLSSLKLMYRNFLLIAAALFSLRFVHQNIHTAQITILIFWLSVIGLVLIEKDRTVAGSLLLAAAINIKLLPVVFVPYLLYRRQLLAAVCVVAWYLLLLFLPSLFIGHQQNMFLLSSWWALVNPTGVIHILDVSERSFHGLSTLLSTLFVKDVPDQYALPYKRNIADISLENLSYVIWTVRGMLVLLTLYFLKTIPFKKPAGLLHSLCEKSYLFLVVPLFFPHQQHYAFLFAVPAFVYCLFILLKVFESTPVWERNTVSCVLAIVYLTANLYLLVGEFNPYYEHYKILTYGALILIPLLAWASRKVYRSPNSVTMPV